VPPREKLRGVVGYPVTPLKAGGTKLDEDRFCTMLDILIESGVCGQTIIGSTGSFGSFAEEERKTIAAVAAGHINGRVRVFIGIGATATDEAIRLAKHAQDVGAAGVQVAAMMHWPLTESELYTYYSAIAAAVSISVVVHNVPALSGMDLQPPLLARLAQIENVVCFKEGSGDLARVSRLKHLTDRDIEIWHDQDATALQGLAAGADVWAPVVSALLPDRCVELYELAVTKKDFSAARRLFDRMFPVIDFVTKKGAVRALHTAFELLGNPVGSPRPPLQLLDGDDRKELDTLLSQSGFFN